LKSGRNAAILRAVNPVPDQKKKRWLRVGIVFGVALLYGFLARLVFGWEDFEEVYPIVGWAFILLAPLAFGALRPHPGAGSGR